MSIIYSYPEQSPISGSDMLIGTSTATVGGKQKNLTKNFTIQEIADFISGGSGIIDPVASDFQIAVFNQSGTRITGSIMSQDQSPSNGLAGTKITISGNLDVTENLVVTKGATIGNQVDLITLNSPTRLAGAIQDANQVTGSNNQILVSSNSGQVSWADYASLSGFGTANKITKWTGTGTTDTLGDSIMTESIGSGATSSRITIAGDLASTAIVDTSNSIGADGQLLSSTGTALSWITPSLTSNTDSQLTITDGTSLTPSINVITGAVGLLQENLATGAVIQAAITDALIGVLEFRGGFNAATGVIDGGTYNLTYTATRVAINVGDFYVVTTSGDFYGDATITLEVGDQVICQTDATVGASLESDWVVVQGNVVIATETVLGVTKYPTGNNSLIVDTTIGNTEGNVTAKIFGDGTGNPATTSVTGGYVPDATNAAAISYLKKDGTWSGDTLANVLVRGNTTGGTDIDVAAGDDIIFSTTSKALFTDGISIYNNYINANGGDFEIVTPDGSGGEQLMASFKSAGYAQLYNNGIERFGTTSVGTETFGKSVITPDTTLPLALALDVKGGTTDASGEYTTEIKIRGDRTTDEGIGFISWHNTASNDTVATINVDRDGADDAGAITFDTQEASGSTVTEKMRISSAGAIKLNAYDGTNNTGTATYVLGTNANGEVVKLLGADIPGNTYYNVIGSAMNYMSRVHDDGGVVEGMEQVMINTEKLILS